MPYSYARPVVLELPAVIGQDGRETHPACFWLGTDKQASEGQICETYLWYQHNVDGFGALAFCDWDAVWLQTNLLSWGFCLLYTSPSPRD